MSFAGAVSAEITIYGTNNEVLTSITFNFTVISVLRDDSAIESTSEFTALTTALNSIEAALVSVPTIEALKIELDDDITSGNALDISLKTDIAEGDITDADLKADIIIAGQNEFATEITNARKGEVDLGTKIGNLDSSLAANTSQHDVINTNISAINAIEAWNTAVLQNGWTANSAIGIQYFKKLGIIYLNARLSSGTTTEGTIVSSLPSGYRPKTNLLLAMVNSTTGAVAYLVILSTGNITISNAITFTAGTVILGNISYRGDN